MILILLGAPGVEKGTVAKMLTKVDGSVQISTGDILHGAVTAGTDLGKEAKGFMDSGALVPDELIMNIMGERLLEDDCKTGFLFDGFPRTIPQAEALDVLLEEIGVELDMVMSLDVPRDVIYDRLTTRRTCENTDCQAIYNVKSMPSKVEGICDKCGSKTIQRADEMVEAISKRLDTYDEMTAPLTGYYKEKGSLFDVVATSSDDVVSAVVAKLG